MKISQDDFDAWQGNPVTEAFFRRIGDMREELVAAWEDALGQSMRADELQMLRVEIKSKRELLSELDDITVEDINDSNEGQKA